MSHGPLVPPPPPTPGRVVAQHFIRLAAGQALLKLLAFGFGVAVVRALGADEFGRYSAALAFAGFFGIATGPGAASFGTREMAADPRSIARLVPDIAALRILLGLLVVPLLVLLAWVLGREGPFLQAVALAGLGLPLYGVIATLDSALVARGAVGRAAACATLRQLVFMATGALALAMGGTGLALLACANLALVARVVVTTYYVRQLAIGGFTRPAVPRWPALLGQLRPFAVEGLADVAGLHLPTLALALVATDAQVGVFAAVFQLLLAALPFSQSLGTALAPVLAAPEAHGSLPAVVGATTRRAALLGLPVTLAALALAAPFALLLYGPAFAASVPALRVLVCAFPVLLLCEVWRAALMALRKEQTVAHSSVGSLLVAAVAALALVAPLAAVGSALTFLVWRLAGALLLALALLRSLPPAAAHEALGLRFSTVALART